MKIHQNKNWHHGLILEYELKSKALGRYSDHIPIVQKIKTKITLELETIVDDNIRFLKRFVDDTLYENFEV
jgi:hypothetical protein